MTDPPFSADFVPTGNPDEFQSAATVTIDGNPVKVTWRYVNSAALTYRPPTRHLPRLTLRRHKHHGWSARWTAQNDSWLEHTCRNPFRAIRQVLAYRRGQRWPIVVWRLPPA